MNSRFFAALLAALLMAVTPQWTLPGWAAGQGKAVQGKAGGKSPKPQSAKPEQSPGDGDTPAADVATKPAAEPPPPPYEPRLLKLSELLGTLAYMRDLCQAGDGAEWRKRMNALIDTEADTQARKERLAGAFNRGFRDYQITYRSCTIAARAVIGRALEEGERITREVASRYAG